MAADQCDMGPLANKTPGAVLGSTRDSQGAGGNNCDVSMGESRDGHEEYLQCSPVPSRRERGTVGDAPVLGHYRMGSGAGSVAKEEEEEGESETDTAAMEGSPLLPRRRISLPKGSGMCSSVIHNNDEDLHSSGEILARSSETLEELNDSERPRSDLSARYATHHNEEQRLRPDHLLVTCDSHTPASDDGEALGVGRGHEEVLLGENQSDEACGYGSDETDGSQSHGEEAIYEGASYEEEEEEEECDDLGFPENFTPVRPAEDSDESDFVPFSDEEEDDSLEFRSYTFDEDISEEEEVEAPPFWFGHEDSRHIEAIMKSYEEELVEQPDPCCRSLKPFIGSIGRVVVATGRHLETFDTVVVCNNQRMDAGKPMPVERTIHVLTSWEPNDGMPESYDEVPAACMEHWEHVCRGKVTFFLFCEPRFFDVGSFSYSGSTSERRVSYDSLPWQSAPFDAVAPLWEQEPSVEDVFPGAQSDIDGPFAASQDPNWSWISGAA